MSPLEEPLMKERELTLNRRGFFLVFDRGDEFIAALRTFAEQHGIRGGWFSGIGGLKEATIAWWDWDSKSYTDIEVREQVEVLSVSGSLTVSEGKAHVHAHITLGASDGRAIGGHLRRGIVRPTLELRVEDFGSAMERALDSETKLMLI
jgi:predicted DNA-binding protein with PD1-like motif